MSTGYPVGQGIDVAAKALVAGQIVGIPTDTVYGLAALALRTGAADRLFAVKRRPKNVDLPVLVADVDQALDLATGVPDVARRLMERWWPGALTLVVPRRPDLEADLGDDEATIGVRCPDHEVPLALCRAVGPLATTSANLHGEANLTTAVEVAAAFGESIALVIDGGTCAGSPSTVVDCTGEELKLLRDGRIAWLDLQASLS